MELILIVGEIAVFRCQHCNSDNIRWRLNGTLIPNGNVPDDVSITYTSQSPCGILFKLTVSDIERYNRTTILCEVDVEGSAIVTTPVTLLVQGTWVDISILSYRYYSPYPYQRKINHLTGTLDSVSNLTRKSGFDASLYTWKAPFSLDVTNADPDIIYCVHVFPVSCHSQPTLLHGVTFAYCNVTDANFTIPNMHELYQIEVLPRINLDVAPNGTQAEYRGWPDKSYFTHSTCFQLQIGLYALRTML